MNKEFVTLDNFPYVENSKINSWSLTGIDFYSEGNYWQPIFYLCLRKPLEELGYTVTVKTFDDIDKTKPWFININPEPWKWNNEKSVFDELPSEWIKELKFGKAYLIVNLENEYWTETFYRGFYQQYDMNSNIPLQKIFLLSGSPIIDETHRDFCVKQKRDKCANVIYSPHQNVMFDQLDVEKIFAVEKPIKSKKFNILNREFRWHRPSFVCLLAELDLLEKGHISLGANSNLISSVNEYGGWKKYISEKFLSFRSLYENHENKFVFERMLSGLELIHDKIPICLDMEEFDTNYCRFEYTPVEYMRDSYFHICSSTFFFDFEEISPGWHEKEWKPILAKQPFLILGRPGMLKLMRRFGFLTFSRWIDESYDDIKDDFKRLWVLSREVKRLCELPDHEWDRMLTEMKNVLDYNYETLMKKKYELFFYGGDLKNLISCL